jgi:flagellar hook-associated protein 2
MGIRMPGLASGVDPKMIDQLVQVEKLPVEAAKKRRESIVEEKKEFDKLNTALNELDGTLNKLKTRGDFNKLKVDSSNPDIIDGTAASTALPGSYEFEVRGLARSEKELAYGFPDKDKTAVGFGFMQIEREGEDPLEITVEPDATLKDVAQQINDLGAGLRAMVVNTKYNPDSYRLLVLNEKSGAESRINIDPDTTFLDFKEQVTGTGLDVLFEDVPVTNDKNSLDELIDGVTFNVKRSEPGTRVQVNIAYDVDTTVESIKAFVEKFNGIANFVHQQFQVDPETRKGGKLSGDSTLRQVMRTLQSQLLNSASPGGKYQNLADIGITTNPKTGELAMDDAKVKAALAEDYEGVAGLFTQSAGSAGIATKVAEAIKGFRDPASGSVKGRQRTFETLIKNQDQEIERRQRMMEQKEQTIRRKFSALETQMAGLQSQGQFLAARFGGGGGGGGGGGAPGGGGAGG